jgi:hypothetical protein
MTTSTHTRPQSTASGRILHAHAHARVNMHGLHMRTHGRERTRPTTTITPSPHSRRAAPTLPPHLLRQALGMEEDRAEAYLHVRII